MFVLFSRARTHTRTRYPTSRCAQLSRQTLLWVGAIVAKADAEARPVQRMSSAESPAPEGALPHETRARQLADPPVLLALCDAEAVVGKPEVAA